MSAQSPAAYLKSAERSRRGARQEAYAGPSLQFQEDMSVPSPVPTLQFYRRDNCDLCDQARESLQVVLEERVRRGDPIARVREVNLSRQPELEEAYGARVPVIAVAGQELALATSARSIGTFLDRVLGRLA